MIRSIIFLFFFSIITNSFSQLASGYVFNDLNLNNIKDITEEGIPGICVSNGSDVIQTDSEGKWELKVTDDTGLFVIKPSNYSVPLSETMIPQYYYLHKPNGSPKLEKGGIKPTGKLPESIDFPLIFNKEAEKFSALFFGDTQASSPHEVNYINHDVVEELIGAEDKFGVVLGDIVGHDLDLFEGISQGISQIGIPWYYVFGNHDNNRDAMSNETRDETFEKYFGPSTYAFEYGQVVFIGFNTVHFDSLGKYKSRFSSKQIDFFENYINYVPEDKLIVLMMHIPIFRAENREQIFDVLKKRLHTFSVSGHVHDQINVFVDEKTGWKSDKPHHHLINATVCGSWWAGQIDETGIPHATMNDGAPNGYSIISFDGNQYSVKFKAARKPEDYQMNIYAPDKVAVTELDTTKVLVNVFGGSERSIVEMQVDEKGNWQNLVQTKVADPECVRMNKLNPIFKQKYNGIDIEEHLGWIMDKPHISYHIWEGHLPHNLSIGAHTIKVRTTDMYGQTWLDNRIFYIYEQK
jgi:C terminal of Calcineurin-like phosphoesterase/N terminal of Calcineurin-like phosphoesterase/Calcineurin-like phosphoesterase